MQADNHADLGRLGQAPLHISDLAADDAVSTVHVYQIIKLHCAPCRSPQAPRRNADAANGMHAVDVSEDAAAQQQAAAKLKASSQLNSLNFDPVNNPHFVDSGRRPPRSATCLKAKICFGHRPWCAAF